MLLFTRHLCEGVAHDVGFLRFHFDKDERIFVVGNDVELAVAVVEVAIDNHEHFSNKICIPKILYYL